MTNALRRGFRSLLVAIAERSRCPLYEAAINRASKVLADRKVKENVAKKKDALASYIIVAGCDPDSLVGRSRQNVIARGRRIVTKQAKLRAQQSRDAKAAVKALHARRTREAMPAWADREAIAAFYLEARRLTRETGIPHEVDHIEPLLGKNASGLHVHYNLRVVTRTENRRKSNKRVAA